METIMTTEKLYLFLGLFLLVSLLVVVAIIVDLWDGVYTARRTGEEIHSHKLRVTIAKMSEYWRFIIIGFLMDCLGFFFSFYILPFVAILFGTGLIITEIKSMFEHARRRKSMTGNLPDIIREIIACVHEKDAREIVMKLKQEEQ